MRADLSLSTRARLVSAEQSAALAARIAAAREAYKPGQGFLTDEPQRKLPQPVRARGRK